MNDTRKLMGCRSNDVFLGLVRVLSSYHFQHGLRATAFVMVYDKPGKKILPFIHALIKMTKELAFIAVG